MRDAPTVELIEDEPQSMEAELHSIEDELRALRPAYSAAKASNDTTTIKEMTPLLQALMSRRKELLTLLQPQAETPSEAQVAGEDDSEFVEFVSIVDDLLGRAMPADAVNDFVQSSDFAFYEKVASSPTSATEDEKAQFFAMVDERLSQISESEVTKFTSSPEFEVYKSVGGRY